MIIARVAINEDVTFALVEGLDEFGQSTARTTVAPIAGHPYQPNPQALGPRLLMSQVRLLPPVLPSKVLGIGRNYAEHAAEHGAEVPAEPLVFSKPSTSVIGPGGAINLPVQSEHVEHEAELAVVIGRLCSDVPAERASDVVLGYTCANDVTARDLQRKDGQWTRAKGFDTFCPLGPWVVTDADPSDLVVTCEVNGELRQRGTTADMVHKIPELIAWVSSVMTLLPGDVILTGTPSGVGPLHDGDEVTVEVAGIGALTNKVVLRD